MPAAAPFSDAAAHRAAGQDLAIWRPSAVSTAQCPADAIFLASYRAPAQEGNIKRRRALLLEGCLKHSSWFLRISCCATVRHAYSSALALDAGHVSKAVTAGLQRWPVAA